MRDPHQLIDSGEIVIFPFYFVLFLQIILFQKDNHKLKNGDLNDSRRSNEGKSEDDAQEFNKDKIKRIKKNVEEAGQQIQEKKANKQAQVEQIERNRSKSQRDTNIEEQKKPQRRGRSISVPQRKKQVKEKVAIPQDQSSDTDCHICECCVIDEFDANKILKNKNGYDDNDDDSDSVDLDSSCDSFCAKILADVASKEIFDPSKIQMILNTKKFQEDKYFEQQKLISQQNEYHQQQQQQQQLFQIQQQQKQSRSSSNLKQRQTQQQQQQQQFQMQSSSVYSQPAQQSQQSSAIKQHPHEQTSAQIKIKEKQQQFANSTHFSSTGKHKKSRSVHALEHSSVQMPIPEILQTRAAPLMEQAPKDKYRIQELIEEMVKQNNRIYKAEMEKAVQDKLEQQEAEKQRKENLKQRIKFIQNKHRMQYLKKLEEKQYMEIEGQEKELHEYHWGLDQRKFNTEQKVQKDEEDAQMNKKKKEQKIDEYFGEFIDKVRQKIEKRKQFLKKETIKRSYSSKKLFSETNPKQQEKMWSSIVPKDLAKKQKQEDEFAKLNQDKKLEEERKAQEILELRRSRFQSANKRNLSNYEQKQAIQERGERAMSEIDKQKKQKAEEKKKMKQKLRELKAKAKEQLQKAKKRDFNTLSEMNFDFSDYQETPNQSKQEVKKKVAKKQVSNKENSFQNDLDQKQKQKQKPQSLSAANIKSKEQGLKPAQSQKQLQQQQQQPKQQKSKVDDKKQQQKFSPEIIQSKQERQLSAGQYKAQQLQQQYQSSNIKQNQDIEEEEEEENILIDQEQYEEIQQRNKEKEMKVNQVVASMNLKNVKIKTDLAQPIMKQEMNFENMSAQGNTKELPEDFIEKIFTTAEMHDLPKEYVLANERKEEKLSGRNFKQFERQIQNELYKRNEKPVYHHLNKNKPDHTKLKSEIPVQKNNIPKNMQKEKARINNFEKKSNKPTQHLLQGEFVYKESKHDGIREIKHIPPKPRQISQEEYKKKQQEMNKVKIIEPAIPPIEMRRRNEKQKSLKEKYIEEYNNMQYNEEKQKEDQIRKQQQYILTHDLEDNIFEMANKVAFHQHDQKKTNLKKEVEKTFGFEDDEDSDQDLYADGIEAYNKARQDMIPDVLKNISKSNFANLIIKQKQDKSSYNLSSDTR